MPYNTKTIKRDSQNIPVPQIFNPSIDDFSALTGVDLGGGRVGADNLMWGKTAGGLYVPVKVSDAGAVATELTGSILAEQLTETDAVVGVLTFTANISTIEIYNTDAVNAGVFTVNGIDINVPAGKVFKSTVGGTPSAEVTITGATTYVVSRYV